MTKSLLLIFTSLTANAAIINGSASGTGADVGSTSKGAYVESIDSSGKLYGASKQRYTLSALNFTAATTEAMITLTPYTDGTAGSTGTTFTIPSNKRLVLQGICVATKNAGAAAQGVIVRIRIQPASAALTTSEPVVAIAAGTAATAAGDAEGVCATISSGLTVVHEISGTAQIGISQIGTATAGNDVTLWGYLY